jgi:hypothetical protein
MLHAKYLTNSEEKFFLSFYNIYIGKTYDPRGGINFDPQGYNFNNLGRGPLDDIIYPISKLLALYLQTRRFFKSFNYIHIRKTYDPPPGTGPILTPGL